MDQEKFERIELTYGCGYWHVCDDHSCPCSPTSAVGKGFDIKVYESMKKQQEKDRENLDLELDCLFCEVGKERACADCCRDWDNEEDKE